MKIRQMILSMMEDSKYHPMSLEELAKLFNLDKKGQKDLLKVLNSLEAEKLIKLDKNSEYRLASDEEEVFEKPAKIKKEKKPQKKEVKEEEVVDYGDLIKGTLDSNERGFGFVIVEGRDKDIFVSSNNYNTAMNGDTVLVEVISEETSDKREEGKIVKVLERKNAKVVGIYKDNKSFGFVIPDNNKLGYDIFIPKSKKSKAKDNQKVVVEITRWPDGDRKPEGEVIEVIGYMSEKGTDIVSIIRQYDLPEEFPKQVVKYVDNNINQEVTDEDLKTRVDLRNETVVTIDGIDAKDLDDAISIRKLENGNYKLGVHIADVSNYVTGNTVLDKEAFNRGNSVYLLDRVIPMLPEELSNGICSLNPNEDRLCLSVTMEIDNNGKVQDSLIQETVINSKARLVYDDVSDYLEDDSDEAKEKLKDVLKDLDLMKELADVLAKKRELRGSIDFDFIETRIVLDDRGKAVDIVEDKRRVANRIIEEFMLITNETVAEQFFWAEVPFLYRIHEEPTSEKMESFSKIIYNLGYKIKGKEIHPKALQQLLEEVKGKDEEKLISILMLRSLQKAVYSEVSNIHFGLAAEYYSHFTAPIRRYPDLVIHRIIKKYINGNLSNKNMKSLERDLPEIADHTSFTERRAEEAEREVEDMKKAEYMKDYIGEEFDGVVSSLTRFGIFVQLENTIEGLIRFGSMKDDYYDFDDVNYLVIGERTKKTYRLGDKVRVVVTDASTEKRNIDFDFVLDKE